MGLVECLESSRDLQLWHDVIGVSAASGTGQGTMANQLRCDILKLGDVPKNNAASLLANCLAILGIM